MVKKRYIFIGLGIALIGIIFASFFDLSIAKAVYFPRNYFGMIMAAFAESPCYLGLGFVGGMLIEYALIKENHKCIAFKIIEWILAIACIFAGAFFFGKAIISQHAFNVPKKWYIGFPISTVLVGGAVFLGILSILKTKTDSKYLFRLLLGTFICLVGTLVIIVVVKPIMNRPRFQWLMSENKLEFFKNWWENGKDVKEWAKASLPNYDSEMFKSFPSGHTASSSCAMVILGTLPILFPNKLKKWQTPFFFIGLGWALLTAFSRMTMGAHFLSDVSFGLLIFLVCYLLVNLFITDKKHLDIDNLITSEN